MRVNAAGGERKAFSKRHRGCWGWGVVVYWVVKEGASGKVIF